MGSYYMCSLPDCGLQQERRALVLKPKNFSYQQKGNTLELEFSLPTGTYATVLLRELCQLKTLT